MEVSTSSDKRALLTLGSRARGNVALLFVQESVGETSLQDDEGIEQFEKGMWIGTQKGPFSREMAAVSRRKIESIGVPAYEIVYETAIESDEVTATCILFQANEQIYLLQGMVRKFSTGPGPEVQRFFEGFRFLSPPRLPKPPKAATSSDPSAQEWVNVVTHLILAVVLFFLIRRHVAARKRSSYQDFEG